MDKKDEQAASAGLSADAVKAMIADALKPIGDTFKTLVADAIKPIAENQKVLADTMAADSKAKLEAAAQATQPADKGKGEPAPLTAEAAQKMIADTVANTLKARDEAAQSTAARDRYVADRMKDVPAVYRAKLGADPAKWDAEQQLARDEMKADDAARGIVIKDVKGGDPGGGTAEQGGAAKPSASASLTPGQASFAAGLVLPKTSNG